MKISSREAERVLKSLGLKAALLASLGFLAACSGGKHSEPNVDLIQDMMEQPAEKAQDFDTVHRDQGSSRVPPEGAVPVEKKPYPFHNDPVGAEKLKNPLAGDFSPATLARGQKKFETYCVPCHGMEGKGDGLVAPKMALKPAVLASGLISQKSDAHYFHVMTDGYGGMGSYGWQINEDRDRWAIVNYVRSLQKLAGTQWPAGVAAAKSASRADDGAAGTDSGKMSGTKNKGQAR